MTATVAVPVAGWAGVLVGVFWVAIVVGVVLGVAWRRIEDPLLRRRVQWAGSLLFFVPQLPRVSPTEGVGSRPATSVPRRRRRAATGRARDAPVAVGAARQVTSTGIRPQLALSCTAARTRSWKAVSSSSSPSWRSIARLVLPSRLALKRPRGSFSEAPLAKVTFTLSL